MKKQTVTLRKEKETPNTIRYTEVEVPGQPPLIRTVYLPKWMAPPNEIRVTVEDANTNNPS